MGFNDEEQYVVMSFSSPITWEEAKLGRSLANYIGGFRKQFDTVIHAMYNHDITWEYSVKNILVSSENYSYTEDGVDKVCPLLVFIDFGSP